VDRAWILFPSLEHSEDIGTGTIGTGPITTVKVEIGFVHGGIVLENDKKELLFDYSRLRESTFGVVEKNVSDTFFVQKDEGFFNSCLRGTGHESRDNLFHERIGNLVHCLVRNIRFKAEAPNKVRTRKGRYFIKTFSHESE
jgi:hypothetical protein